MKTYREEFRDDNNIQTMRTQNSDDAFDAEGLGLWRKQSKGWYTQEVLDVCRELGASRGVLPIIGAFQCPFVEAKRETHFFCGADPAPAQGKRSDDGTLFVLRSSLRPGRSGESTADWDKDLVYAHRMRNKDVDDWAGLIHEKHDDFGFTGMCIDLGGGGQWIGPALQRSRQKIRGEWISRKPILPLSTNAMEGQPLYFLLSRGEEVLKAEGGLWREELKNARGDDVLKDLANTMFQVQIEKGMIGFPPRFNKMKPEEMAGWTEERKWAAKNIDALERQCLKYRVVTKPDGTWKLTAHNAKQFFSEIREDDFHDAARNALVAFEVWLLTYVDGMSMGAGRGGGARFMGF